MNKVSISVISITTLIVCVNYVSVVAPSMFLFTVALIGHSHSMACSLVRRTAVINLFLDSRLVWVNCTRQLLTNFSVLITGNGSKWSVILITKLHTWNSTKIITCYISAWFIIDWIRPSWILSLLHWGEVIFAYEFWSLNLLKWWTVFCLCIHELLHLMIPSLRIDIWVLFTWHQLLARIIEILYWVLVRLHDYYGCAGHGSKLTFWINITFTICKASFSRQMITCSFRFTQCFSFTLNTAFAR